MMYAMMSLKLLKIKWILFMFALMGTMAVLEFRELLILLSDISDYGKRELCQWKVQRRLSW